MRELKRSIAKANMAGIPHKFQKRQVAFNPGQSGKSFQQNGYKKRSYFALHWREYV